MLVEASAAGDSVLGVFTSVGAARALIPAGEGVRLEDYRIECHAVDAPADLYSPWQVSMTRDGSPIDVTPIIACAYCDELETVLQASFVEEGGELMRLAVFARSKGRALAAAVRQHAYLVENDLGRRARCHWSRCTRRTSSSGRRTRTFQAIRRQPEGEVLSNDTRGLVVACAVGDVRPRMGRCPLTLALSLEGEGTLFICA